ncbi:hypothetical protein MK489_03625 [Myxococcota bacterium]|nr:hypothetical protein [Myxococcota bacterium]
MTRPRSEVLLLAAALALFATLLFKHLSYPLFWSDEADTAMFGTRVLEYGYPRVHGPRNVVYQFGNNVAQGVDEATDAYIGTTWGHFYFAVPGLLAALGSDDFYAKTFRVRLPFALAGALGVAVWVAAVLPVFGGDRRRVLLFTATFFILASISVSLILHLREARYYPLLVLLSGIALREHLRYTVFSASGPWRYTWALAATLFLIFNTFYSAWFAFAGLLGAERALAIWRGRAPWSDLAPFVLSALSVAPLLVFFETFQIAAGFASDLGLGVKGWLSNLTQIATHLMRHEFLAAALLGRLAVVGMRVGSLEQRRTAALLAGFGLGYAALGALNPLPLERYFVVLSPLLIALFLLDAFVWVQSAPSLLPRLSTRSASRFALILVLAVVGVTRWPAVADVEARVAEITTPYRGPLDFAIPHIASGHVDPASLTIATNYEEQAFMYYLGSRVIVGVSLNNLRRDREAVPDVVVPRRRWPRSLRELKPFLRRGTYRRERLPVVDLHFNNVPSLSASRFVPEPHRFHTARTDDDAEMLAVYWREDP